MAEAALFSVASKLLSTIASPAFDVAYERARSIWGAKEELDELRETIETIQAKLLDAEKKHKDSAEVKNWIDRVRDVLYDAEDLFDEVATHDRIKQQMKAGKHMKEVRVFFSKLNPVVSRDSIAKKVKGIRKSLHKISSDMALFGFVSCTTEDERWIGGKRRGVETAGFVDPNEVIGRDDEKKVVLDFLFDESYVERNLSLISVVGIGGMGKSTLAQLVYNDGKILSNFKYKYWACISGVLNEHELIGKIYQSMADQEQYDRLSLNQLQERIRKLISDLGERFLLVLDDLWDEDPARGIKLWSILSSDVAKGSKIIITTRHSSVSEAYRADTTLALKGLSSDASWQLFKRLAFSEKQESDPTWISLGEKIVDMCVNVPLAIKTIASLLRIKNTREEWKSFADEELSKIELSDNPIMSTLRLSYDHLPSHLKNCFAYCSLFPKDSSLEKKNVIYLWIAQGFVKPKKNESLETTGCAYFMELLRRSFFEEEAKEYFLDLDDGDVRYRMHDLIHDLAQDVSGEETLILTPTTHQLHKRSVRHLCVAYEVDDTWSIPLLQLDRLRSCLFIPGRSHSSRVLDQQVTKLRFLHALDFRNQRIAEVPCSIGELKYLRYLNLSDNSFSHLPDSITKLSNLLTLDISKCQFLRDLPGNIQELMNLTHLRNSDCDRLLVLPPSFGELTSLEHLSEFRVSKSGGGDDALARLNLRGKLMIIYDNVKHRKASCKDDLELENWHIPCTIEELVVGDFPGTKIPTWWREDPASRMTKLECLTLQGCKNVKHLPPLRFLPCLRALSLFDFDELEYMEEDNDEVVFFPCLVKLELIELHKLEGWSRRVNAANAFPFLSELKIIDCPLLVSMPLAPRLQSLFLLATRADLVPTCSMSSPSTTTPSYSLQEITIAACEGQLTSFRCEGLTSLRKLKFVLLEHLRNVKLAPNLVEEFTVDMCPELELWENREGEQRSVDWGSFTNLRLLTLDDIPEPEELPECLQQLVSLGKLQIEEVRW